MSLQTRTTRFRGAQIEQSTTACSSVPGTVVHIWGYWCSGDRGSWWLVPGSASAAYHNTSFLAQRTPRIPKKRSVFPVVRRGSLAGTDLIATAGRADLLWEVDCGASTVLEEVESPVSLLFLHARLERWPELGHDLFAVTRRCAGG